MSMIWTVLLLLGLAAGVKNLSLQATGPQTCIALQVESEGEKIMISYHQNLHLGSVRMVIYGLDGQILADSQQGVDYHHYLQVVFSSKGLYDMCFEKNITKNLEVNFQILRETEQLEYAGKEDLGRLTRRVGDFLVEIKKSGWEYKQVLAQHNRRNEKLRDYQSANYVLYGMKILAMICVLSVQIWAVRKIFD